MSTSSNCIGLLNANIGQIVQNALSCQGLITITFWVARVLNVKRRQYFLSRMVKCAETFANKAKVVCQWILVQSEW